VSRRGPPGAPEQGLDADSHRRWSARREARRPGLRPPHPDRPDGRAPPRPRLTRARALALWAPPLLYGAAIFWESSQAHPFPFVPPAILMEDKLLHFAGYALLGALLYRAARGSGAGRARAVAIAVLGAAAYGATDELHQAYVPGRSMDLWDWVADALGAAAGALAARAFGLRRRRAAG
jgi:hypothetical protein